MTMLDLDPNREGVKPRDAATLVVVRDVRGDEGGIEVFCVERQKVGFLGGAVVFPGGKLDATDMDAGWASAATAPRAPRTPIADDDATLRALAVAACREALEEAAILPLVGTQLSHDELLALRKRAASGESLLSMLTARGARLDLAALHPVARWVTPVAESRRFDTRFFLYVAEAALTGAHDDHETTASFWATPADVLGRFVAGSLQLAPPTHRTLEMLATAPDVRAAVALADASCLDPVCPRLVKHRDTRGETLGLALPGDPEHDVRELRSPGRTRYVLRGDRFLPEDPPR
jgi:8-oxo-dGTP pyrophosphatase MutT (NUDIX family)